MWFIMGVPRGLLLLLSLQIFTGCTSGTRVTSCDSCHNDATCLESRKRGDSFINPDVYCVCKVGFVGDGLTCYNTKLCGDSSCCSRGYQWSPERGCVDTDECSLPDSPCIPPQVCQNTLGSFKCLEPSPNARSGVSSVQSNCGHVVCPFGMDCISNNRSLCADPCEDYTVLNDDWRSVNNTSQEIIHCDKSIDWQGWYRLFLGQNSAHIPEWCVDENRCGTDAPMWITEPHPTQIGEIVERTVCNSWSASCCQFSSHTIHVKLCYGNFYVYKLAKPSACSLAYCAVTDVNPTNPPVPSTTPATTPPQPFTTNQVVITTATTAGNSTEVEGQIRLANGSSSCSGRVEIFHSGQWRTVCDDSWSLLDAHVVCRQLGCGRAISTQYFGQGTGPIWLDEVMCTGKESKLTECSHRGNGSPNCNHQGDAGVVCEADSPVRLVNSDNRCSGRVEIQHNGQWGTVCDDNWDLNDANVVCRQLGCGTARSALPSAAYGAGSGPIWLDDVNCHGSESSITDCRHPGLGVNNCQHVEDASVVCETQHPQFPPLLICGRDKLQIGLDLAGVASSGFDPFSGNLAARNCSQFRVRGSAVWYEVEAREGVCGNTLRTNSTHAIYSNSLFIYPRNNMSFSHPASLPFSCAYPLDTEASLNVAISPFLSLADGILGSGSKAKASMSLFRSSNYTDTYPSGQIVLPVGSPLYVAVSMEEMDSLFVVVLEDCFATHSSNPDDPMRYYLIQNKCPTDRRQVSVTESGLSLRARFTALLFLLQDEYQDTFLHCSLSLCDQRRSSCVPPCTSRKRRSVSTAEPLKPLTIGPIIWVK